MLQSGTLSFTDIWGSLPTRLGGHGAMFGDADGDGLPDLYMPYNYTPGTRPDLFIRNDGTGLLVEEGAARGIDDLDGGSHGAAWADLDNDGDYDLVNGTTYNAGGIPAWNNVFENDGTGFFTEVTPLSMQVEKPTRALVAFDLDADGDLDLFGVTNSGGSADPSSERNEIYRNDGALQFTALTSGPLYTARIGQGATDTDFDGDGDVDILACNRNGPVGILRNDGGGAFVQVVPTDLGIPNTNLAGDGVTSADIDNDDDLDLLFTKDNAATLYRNDGATFTFAQSFSGTDGYSGAFGDLDHDGDQDLVFTGAATCWLNDGAGAFTPGPAVPVSGLNDPRGVALADLDGDGDLDFALGVKNSRSRIVRNDFDAGRWLKVELVSPEGQAGAFGAKTRIYAAGEAGGTPLALRESKSNHGYLAQDDPVLHFGLGGHTSVDVVVTFLDGTVVTRTGVAANQTILVDDRTRWRREGRSPPPRLRTPPADVAARAPAPAVSSPLLGPSFPNPFVTSTTIVWRQEADSPVELAVFDARGRRIRTLAAGPRLGGVHRVTWDGRDERGVPVAGGVYFYRLRVAGSTETERLTLLR